MNGALRGTFDSILSVCGIKYINNTKYLTVVVQPGFEYGIDSVVGLIKTAQATLPTAGGHKVVETLRSPTGRHRLAGLSNLVQPFTGTTICGLFHDIGQRPVSLDPGVPQFGRELFAQTLF